MYDLTMREHALALLDEGLTISETSRRTGIARSSIREWRLRTSQGRDLYVRPRARVSLDIQKLFTDALDRLGVAWTRMNAKNISVARREAVARLDEFVGPKH